MSDCHCWIVWVFLLLVVVVVVVTKTTWVVQVTTDPPVDVLWTRTMDVIYRAWKMFGKGVDEYYQS